MKQTPAKAADWRARAAIAVVSVLAAYNALIQFGVTDQFSSQYPDPYHVMELQARLSRVLDRIPPQERVGYFSDVPFTEPAGQAAFFAAQYAVAPRIAVKEGAKTAPQTKFWIGVFPKQDDFVKRGREKGLLFEQDLGGFVIFYRRQEAAQ